MTHTHTHTSIVPCQSIRRQPLDMCKSVMILNLPAKQKVSNFAQSIELRYLIRHMQQRAYIDGCEMNTVVVCGDVCHVRC